ncbi:MAG TPA: membrane protein insertion efficiency factor YidD [Mycobacteriales bacterium]|nr:membrane protein insertion efficiency factor YidD [Mycobacteriales bacterium]
MSRPPHVPGRPTRVLLLPVSAYRRWVSPALPARCRFTPSCSAYADVALRTHGARRGSWLALRRLARCHPFHPGGPDPVPAVPEPLDVPPNLVQPIPGEYSRPRARTGAPGARPQ